MMNWTLSDVDEYGYEYECSACKQHVRASGFLPAKCPHCGEKSKRKYVQGQHINTLGALDDARYIYFGDKIINEGWYGSMQLRVLRDAMQRGHLYYAIPVEEV